MSEKIFLVKQQIPPKKDIYIWLTKEEIEFWKNALKTLLRKNLMSYERSLAESKAVELLEVWIRQSAPFSNVSAISVFKKITDKYDKEEVVEDG